jgi:hypothetical protein
MEQLNIYLATEFTEFYLNKEGYLTPIHFVFPTDDKRNIIDRYINAIDLVLALGYKNPVKAWTRLQIQYSLFDIEYSLIFTGGIKDEEVYVSEDFLTLAQVRILLENTTRIGVKEKQRLFNFIVDSI